MVASLGYFILFAPLAACVAIGLLTLSDKKSSAAISIGAMLLGFLASLLILGHLIAHPAEIPIQASIDWIHLGPLTVEFGVLLDPLSTLMLLVVTGIGSAIFIYSTAYMAEDPGFSRYFAYLSLFAFSMLGIILSNNFIQIFIFWELVGVSSYLLIGFWYEKPSAADAGKKAFMVNRIGDFGFILGILMIWVLSGTAGAARTLNFVQLQTFFHTTAAAGLIPGAALALAAALLFCGVLGKSAQFPLHVWLPDAMEGPTPVSALIHAATMVAAGIYLLSRTFFLYSLSPEAMHLVAFIGGFTSLFAASLAIVQNDIKRILAYSTLSQLGYMVMALGLGGETAGMFHLTTHAFFKALLFLGAGSVIHSLHTQDIWEMGGITKKMPVTTATFLIGTLALAGIFPLAGFWSKDEILSLAYEKNFSLYIVGTLVALLTAFYMGRLIFVAFFGKERKAHHHAHESPASMTAPLILLAIFSVIGGFIGIPQFVHRGLEAEAPFNFLVAAISTIAALGGIGLAYAFYGAEILSAEEWAGRLKPVRALLIHKFYIDDFYDRFLVQTVQQSIAALSNLFERYVIIGFAVNGVAWVTERTGNILRRVQTGMIHSYVLFLMLGVTVMMYLFVALQTGGAR